MKKEEILERNKKSLKVSGDEREELITGKANVVAKGVFTVTIALLILFNKKKGLETDSLWGIFFVYCSSEAFYKNHYLKEKKILLSGIFFAVAAICCLVNYFFVRVW